MSALDFILSQGLPEGARPDLAYTEQLDLVTAPVTTTAQHRVRGDRIDIVLSARVVFTSSAVVGDRGLNLVVFGRDGQAVWSSVPPNVQPASQSWAYIWTLAGGGSYSNAGALGAVSYLPPYPLLPGWTMAMGWSPSFAGDTLDRFILNVLRIPTGPRLVAPRGLDQAPLNPALIGGS